MGKPLVKKVVPDGAKEQDGEQARGGASSPGSSDVDARTAARAEGDAHGRFAGSPADLTKAG